MATENTVLSKNDLQLLESMVIRHGKIVEVSDLKRDVEQQLGQRYSDQVLRNRLSDLTKKGWLVRLRRGTYLIVTDISALGMSDISDFVIAAAFNSNAYVSFEGALQYYGMFDQKLSTIDSVTTGRNRTYKVEGNKTYRFLHIQDDLFFGSEDVQISGAGRAIKMADREKALLDMLYYRSDTLTASLVLEKLRDYQGDIDLKKLQYYALHYSTSTVRKVGFLLDQLGEDSGLLFSDKIKENSYSKLGSNAKTFNAKWRLYYDDKLTH